MDYLLLFGSLLSYLLLYKYVALFVLIFLAGIGLPIPSGTLLMAVGAFASQGYFDLPLSLATALVANILGDLCDYFLMRRYGRALIKKNYQHRFAFIVAMERYIAILDKYIKGHQRITIFISRFFGSASTIVNFLSGLIPVPLKTFLIYDALGNLVSIAGMIAAGFFISQSWQTVAGIIGGVSTSISLLVIVIVVVFIIRKVKKSKALH